MEPPPPSLSSTAVASTSILATTALVPPPPPLHVTSSYPESLESSPHSRTTDGWDDLPAPSGGGGGSTVSSKIRLMCSYGGHILPRPHDKSLCYMVGDTRIIVVDRNTSLSSLLARLSNMLLDGRSFTLKCQLPSEDLDSLISVTTDEDLDNMIEEYDRTISASNSTKPSRLRLFLFTSKPEAMGQILESSAKSDDWFLNALNSAGLNALNSAGLLNRGFSDSDTNVNHFLGLDHVGEGDLRDDGSVKSAKQQQIQQPPTPQQQPQPQGSQDVHCLPDSPMLDTSSSFGSTSSSPSLANLPPIRVHVEEPTGVRTLPDQKNLGIEEQFTRFNVGSKQLQQQQDDGFAAMSSPPPMPVTIALPAATISNESHTRFISDDERSDHSVPAGYRKPPTPRS
ncbi:PREDICTED: myocyte-specific enhancer factor 2A-like [Camelina sativa]|uniref:Myocyte-specific enhancer factor 2A-like n=1 Tax=Camelina sativa TaxID=90675 RepID=A0ABM1QG00_CAMSA|nr:PREDICTED: myocyte-specific enhancer factor 2A-like [Camelina sativa]